MIALLSLLALLVLALIGIGGGILRFHGSISAQHLRGRYTWADEMAALDAQPDEGERN